jgi:hypothetical protein
MATDRAAQFVRVDARVALRRVEVLVAEQLLRDAYTSRSTSKADVEVDPEERKLLLEQYKLTAEMADRISARRGIANSFYFTVSSALLATSESLSLPFAAGAGMILAAAWWLQLRSYRRLNAAKWTVINALERELPGQPFSDEWKIIKGDPVDRAVLRSERLGRAIQPLARYTELSVIEQVVPAVFCVLFAITLGRSVS